MNSDEEFNSMDFSCLGTEVFDESTDHSELKCDNDSPNIGNPVLDESYKETSLTDDEDEEDLFFSSVADFEKELENNNEKEIEDKTHLMSIPSLEQTSSFTKNFKKIKLNNELSKDQLELINSQNLADSTCNVSDKELQSQNDKEEQEITDVKEIEMTPEVGFKTGNNRKIIVNAEVLNRAPKFSPAFRKGPMRSYNCPEKGHISSEIEERNRYMTLFEKVRKLFLKIELSLFKIQFRWVWLNLFANNQLNDTLEATRLLIEGLRIRLSSEYSIIRRIIEGDDVSYRYMILLVLSFNKDTLEVFDGYFTCKIQVDKLLSRFLLVKNVTFGVKIKLFGCKLALSSNMSILDYKDDDIAMYAFYNAFDFALCNRVLGYRKKISFRKNIKDIRKDGGIVSCLKGTIKRIVDSRYVVQVKGYRNSVENLEAELDNIQNLIEKTKEEITNEDVKIKKYVRFILEDSTGECLVTSWMYTEDIKKGVKIMFCGLKPVESALGLHLSTNKQTFIKLYDK